jgi:predicted permease
MKNLLNRLFARFHSDDELREEMESHIRMRADLHQAQGLSEEDAAREARLRFGNTTRIHEDVRSVYVWRWLETMLQDVRYSVRTLLKSPSFTLIAVATLALAIGANAAIFQLLDTVVLKPLPVRDPYQLFELQGYHGANATRFSYPLLTEMAKRQTVAAGIFASGGIIVDEIRAGGREVRQPWAVRLATGNYFDLIGTTPQQGRLFSTSDDDPAMPLVAVISDHFWQQEFGGQPNAIGSSLQINGITATIGGVTRPEFTGESIGEAIDIWLPIRFAGVLGASSSLTRSSIWLQPIARLRPDVSPEQAQAELSLLWSQLREFSIQFRGVTDYRLEVLPAAHGLGTLRGQFSESLWLLMGTVGLVMLIACCNLATLLLGRARARSHEIGVRLSMGAGRPRVVRQLLTESLLLVALGAGLGLILAVLTSRQLLALASAGEPWRLWIGLDWRVIGFTLTMSVIAVLVFGLAPALTATRVSLNTALQGSSATLTGARSHRTVTRAFVIAQVALSLTLITGAGRLIRSFWNLTHQDLGFNPKDVVMASVGATREGNLRALINPETHQAIYRRAGEVPGVRSASVGPELFGWIPYAAGAPIALPDRIVPKTAGVRVLPVSPHFVETLGIPPLRGRSILDSDQKTAPRIAVVNQTAARLLFDTAEPIGRVFSDGDAFRLESEIEVVGVVGDFRVGSARGPFEPVILVPLLQRPAGAPPNIVLRTSGALPQLREQLQAAMRDVAPGLGVDPLKPLDNLVRTSVRREHLLAWLSGGFAVLALLLAAVGLYGIVNYSTQVRTQEIGLRLAIGATSQQVIFHVLGETVALLAVGMLLGTLATLGLSSVLQTMLFGLRPNDPLTLIVVAALLSAVGLGACYAPARRATRLDPITVLRRE